MKTFVTTRSFLQMAVRKILCLPLYVVLLTVVLSACATVFSKSTYPVIFSGAPEDTMLSITDKDGFFIREDKLPFAHTLDAHSDFFTPAKYTLEVTHPDYNTRTYYFKPELDGWFIPSAVFILGGIGVLFVLVDGATGAMWKLDITKFVQLKKKEAALGEEGKLGLRIYDIRDLPAGMRAELEAMGYDRSYRLLHSRR